MCGSADLGQFATYCSWKAMDGVLHSKGSNHTVALGLKCVHSSSKLTTQRLCWTANSAHIHSNP